MDVLAAPDVASVFPGKPSLNHATTLKAKICTPKFNTQQNAVQQ